MGWIGLHEEVPARQLSSEILGLHERLLKNWLIDLPVKLALSTAQRYMFEHGSHFTVAHSHRTVVRGASLIEGLQPRCVPFGIPVMMA